MTNRENSVLNEKNLVKLFKRKSIMDMERLQGICRGRSKRSLFRDLNSIGYLSSYSHAGKFYTLAEIPNFDEYGLWAHEKVYFSKFGTLKASICKIVENSTAGFTHREIKKRFNIRVQNALNDLIEKKIIFREFIKEVYLYVSADKKVSSLQIAKRQEQISILQRFQPADSFVTIEILLELLHSDDWLPQKVATRLQKKDISATAEQVNEIFSRYKIKKKSSYD